MIFGPLALFKTQNCNTFPNWFFFFWNSFLNWTNKNYILRAQLWISDKWLKGVLRIFFLNRLVCHFDDCAMLWYMRLFYLFALISSKFIYIFYKKPTNLIWNKLISYLVLDFWLREERGKKNKTVDCFLHLPFFLFTISLFVDFYLNNFFICEFSFIVLKFLF